MSRHWLRKPWGILLLLLCLLLSGCGAQIEVIDEGQEDMAPWQTAEGEDAVEEEPQEVAITSFALAYHDGQTLDPITCGDGAQLQLTALLYEPLFQLDESFQPQPVLCSGYTVSEDGLVYTLTIRQGVLFSDGSVLDASDAAASLRRAMTSQRYGNRLGDIRQVTTRGSSEVVITLSRANSRLTALLDIPVVKDGTETDAAPIGTGPYLFITSSEGAYLAANPDWWQGRDLPVDRIELADAKDSDTILYLFTSREVQVVAADLTQGNTALTGSLDTVDLPTATMQFLGLNARRASLQEQALRQALYMGIPRETVVEGYLSGHALPAQLPLSPMAEEYPEALDMDYSLDTYQQALMTPEDGEATTQRTLTLLVNGDNASKTAVAQYVAQSLTVDGVLQVEVEALPWAEYLQALESGDFDLYYGEVRLTADWDLAALVGTGGALNFGGWSSEETDALLEACRTGGTSERLSLCRHLQEVVPIIPVCFKNDSLLTHSGTIENIQATAANIFYNFPDWIIHMADSVE